MFRKSKLYQALTQYLTIGVLQYSLCAFGDLPISCAMAESVSQKAALLELATVSGFLLPELKLLACKPVIETEL
eukprot:IDg14591t1